MYVDPRYTSQTCSACSQLGKRTKHRFVCPYCGLRAHSDLNTLWLSLGLRLRWSPCAQRLECKSKPAGIGLSADSPRAVVNRPNVELLCNYDK